MDRYLGGEDIDLKVLIDDLETAVARGSFYPGARRPRRPPGSASAELLEVITQALPVAARARAAAGHHARRRAARRRSRATRPARWSPRSSRRPPTRTSAGSRWSGSSPARCARTRSCTSPATVLGRPRATRTTTSTRRSARCPRRWARRSARSPQCIAGDICAVAKLTRAETGDTLSDKDHPLLMEPWVMPEPLLPVAVVAQVQGRRGQAVARASPGSSPRTRRCASR